MKKKNQTPRCVECRKLIFSKKRVRTKKSVYHITCYKNRGILKDAIIQEIQKEMERHNPLLEKRVATSLTHIEHDNIQRW